MHSERELAVHCGDLVLDARVLVPEGATRGCVVCHPHPLYGGDMRSGVVTGIVRALADAGIATLRFDFRGTGRSTGRHDGGRGEVEDVAAAVAALSSAMAERAGASSKDAVAGHAHSSVAVAGYAHSSVAVAGYRHSNVAVAGYAHSNVAVAGYRHSNVAVAGYSFGAMVALGFVGREAAGGVGYDVAAVAPPLAMAAVAMPKDPGSRVLLLAGDRDDYCPRRDLEAAAAGAGATATILDGADHFFAGREAEVGGHVARFLAGA